MADTPRKKGLFGSLELPLATQYLRPAGRARLLIVGTGFGAVAALGLLASMQFDRSRFISKGPLSSAHANLEGNCVVCHTAGGAVSDEKCALCHEKAASSTGLLHTFPVHYVYMSGDRSRAHTRGNEVACAACHTEHGGRTASLTIVADRECRSCHAFSFGSHPEFAFAAGAIPDDRGLAFTHIRHAERVMDRQKLGDLEEACAYCHDATPNGRFSRPIDFDRHCASCHLDGTVQSDPLPLQASGVDLVAVRDGRAMLSLGVEPLDVVRRRLGAGETWAAATSPSRFDVFDGRVVEYGIRHSDPWIMHNLQLLRRAAYPDDGLDDLLQASGDVPLGGDRRELYDEALATLRAYADGLRGHADPGVQDELVDIDTRIHKLEQHVASPVAMLSDSRFRSQVPRRELSAAQLAGVDSFSAQIAKPCLECHRLEQAMIVRVQKDQQALRRARFNHQAHVLQRDCLSCHKAIPFLDHLGAEGPIDPAIDNAAIQNLPRLAECQTCHTPQLASNRCVTCHLFHPKLSRAADE